MSKADESSSWRKQDTESKHTSMEPNFVASSKFFKKMDKARPLPCFRILIKGTQIEDQCDIMTCFEQKQADEPYAPTVSSHEVRWHAKMHIKPETKFKFFEEIIPSFTPENTSGVIKDENTIKGIVNKFELPFQLDVGYPYPFELKRISYILKNKNDVDANHDIEQIEPNTLGGIVFYYEDKMDSKNVIALNIHIRKDKLEKNREIRHNLRSVFNTALRQMDMELTKQLSTVNPLSHWPAVINIADSSYRLSLCPFKKPINCFIFYARGKFNEQEASLQSLGCATDAVAKSNFSLAEEKLKKLANFINDNKDAHKKDDIKQQVDIWVRNVSDLLIQRDQVIAVFARRHEDERDLNRLFIKL